VFLKNLCAALKKEMSMNPEMGNPNTLDLNTLLWEPIRQNGEKVARLLPNIIDAFYILVF
jgi:hypothetical protein